MTDIRRKSKEEVNEASLTLLDYLIEGVCKGSEPSSELVHSVVANVLTSLVSSRECGVH